MRITFDSTASSALGQLLSGFIKQYTDTKSNSPITHKTLANVEKKFHGNVRNNLDYQRVATEHASKFADPIWALFGQYAPQIQSTILRKQPIVSDETGPIVAGTKDALDLIAETEPAGDYLKVSALNIDKGGLGANTAEALRLLEMHAQYIPLLGKGPRANVYNDLIDASGIHRSQSVFSDDDGYLHTCIFFGEGEEKKEYWMAQYRKTFPHHTIEEFTKMIDDTCSRHKGETLVLSAIPPAGAGDDYFTKLITIAEKSGNPTMFNPKQYDPMEQAVTHMFKQRKLGYIKPNLVEFVEFLKYSGLIKNSSSTKDALISRLSTQIKQGEFDETIELAKKLIHEVNPDMVIFLSYGAQGAMAVNRKFAVLTTTPDIGKVGCSSGAGDSGLASILKEAKTQKINLLDNLHSDDLAKLIESFVWGASATTKLPGNQIAGLAEIAALKTGQSLHTKVKSLS